MDRFCQDGRIRIRQPRRNLQIKFPRPISKNNDFVAYIDAIRNPDGVRCLIEWKTTSSRYSEEPDGLLPLDPQLGLLFLDDGDHDWANRVGPVLAHSGICFPQNPCSSCPYVGLCLGKQGMVETGLVRRPGAENLGWPGELAY